MKKRFLIILLVITVLMLLPVVNALGEDKNIQMRLFQNEEKAYNGEFIENGEIVIKSITDGLSIEDIRIGEHDDFERIVFELSGEKIPWSSVKAYENPQTLTVELVGIRGYNSSISYDTNDSKYIKNVYSMITLDDCVWRCGIEFTENIEFKVTYLRNPSRIVIDFKPREEDVEEKAKKLYSLRSGTYILSEEVGHIEEYILYEWEAINARFLETYDGRIFVEEGIYDSYEEAEKRKLELEKKMKKDEREFKLYIVEIIEK